MTLLEQWRGSAYNENMTQEQYNQFWNHYFVIEKGFYESLLADNEVVTGTIPQLAEKYGIDKMVMVGILDGINDSLKQPNPIETMDETTELSLDYDKEKLYYNMVGAKALYPSSVGCTSYSRAPQGALQRAEVFYHHRKG